MSDETTDVKDDNNKSHETTNDKNDNNENKNIESGMQKSGNGEENDLSIEDDVDTGKPNCLRKNPLCMKDCQRKE